jgi:NAD+ synthase
MTALNYELETNKIVRFIQDTFEKKGFKNAVIGVSGGIDSAVIVALCVKALGNKHVYGFGLPCNEQKDINDSRKLAGLFDINYEEINIYPAVNEIADNVMGYNIGKDKSRWGNIASRTRMIILFDKSAQHKGLVVGTSNKTELMLGYFTSHGDGACALEPIGHLFKTEVFELAKYLGIPESIITKAPTAGLWEGQTDEGEIGATYKDIDLLLPLIERREWETVIKMGKEHNELTDKLEKMIAKNKFKLEPLPILER